MAVGVETATQGRLSSLKSRGEFGLARIRWSFCETRLLDEILVLVVSTVEHDRADKDGNDAGDGREMTEDATELEVDSSEHVDKTS